MMDKENCRYLLGELSEYLDGGLSAEMCAEIERHLADCADCRVVVDTLRKTVLLYREAPQPNFPLEARERLYKALDLTEFL
jgi:anti-sigma factor RsiW